MDIAVTETGILAIESQIDKLFLLVDNIEKANGMCKAFAMEAIEVIPNFGKNTPIAYYTKEPSIARHTVALEEIMKNIWDMIVAAGKAVLEYASKFITWLFGKGNGAVTSETVLAIEKRLSDGEYALQQLEQLYIDKIRKPETFSGNAAALEDNSTLGKMPRTLNEILDNYVKTDGRGTNLASALKVEDPLFHDVIHNGEYSKTIKSTNQVVSTLPIAVDTSAKSYLRLVTKVEGHMKSLGNSKEDINPVDINLQPIALDVFGNGKRITIAEAASIIESKRKEVLESNNNDATVSFTMLSNLFAKAINNSNISNILKKIESTKNYMDSILAEISKANAEMAKLSTHVVSDPIGVKYGHALRDAFKNVRLDILNCFKFFHELMQYAKLLHNMDTKLAVIQKAAIQIIESEIKKHNGVIPEEFKELKKNYINSLTLDFT